MSEIRYTANTATCGVLVQTFLAASMALGAHEGIDEVLWPNYNAPAYVAPVQEGSFSLYNQEAIPALEMESSFFAGQMMEIYVFLSEDQEPLSAEFAAVWDSNIELLYES